MDNYETMFAYSEKIWVSFDHTTFRLQCSSIDEPKNNGGVGCDKNQGLEHWATSLFDNEQFVIESKYHHSDRS